MPASHPLRYDITINFPGKHYELAARPHLIPRLANSFPPPSTLDDAITEALLHIVIDRLRWTNSHTPALLCQDALDRIRKASTRHPNPKAPPPRPKKKQPAYIARRPVFLLPRARRFNFPIPDKTQFKKLLNTPQARCFLYDSATLLKHLHLINKHPRDCHPDDLRSFADIALHNALFNYRHNLTLLCRDNNLNTKQLLTDAYSHLAVNPITFTPPTPAYKPRVDDFGAHPEPAPSLSTRPA